MNVTHHLQTADPLVLSAVYQTPAGVYVRILHAYKSGVYLAVRVHLHRLEDFAGHQLYLSARYACRLNLAWTAAQWAAKQADRAAGQVEIERKREQRELRDAEDDSRAKAIAFEEKARKAHERRLIRASGMAA